MQHSDLGCIHNEKSEPICGHILQSAMNAFLTTWFVAFNKKKFKSCKICNESSHLTIPF